MFEAVAVAVACGRPVARVTPAPPAPIVARSACGTYEIDAAGTVRQYRKNWAPLWAPAAVSHPGPGVWVAHPHGRLAVYRDGGLLWRSRIRVASDEVVVHGSSIAFGRYARYETDGGPTLWMARVGGREFRVADDEDPIGWTAGGLVAQHLDKIVVRGPDGTLYRTLAFGHSAQYDAGNATVVFVRRNGAVVRTDGKHLWQLKRRVGRSAWVVVLGNRMLQVTQPRRTVYLRPDGSRLGVGPPSPESVGGFPGRRVGYVVRQKAGNVVFLLDAAGKTHRLYSHRVRRASCGEYAAVTYANRRLLFFDDEGSMAILDPSGRTRPIELTHALSVLQPKATSRWQLYADWLSNWR